MKTAYIRLCQSFSEQEYFSIELTLDRQLYLTCDYGTKRGVMYHPVYVDPDTISECVAACQWLISLYPEHTEQIEHILADFFTLAHSCTGNMTFAAILRELGKQEEAKA